MPKRSFRFPSILARHATQPVRDATAQDTGPPTTAPRRQRQGVFRGLLPLGRRRGADGPPSTGTPAGSAPRVTAASPRLSRETSRASLPETPSVAEPGAARQAPKPRVNDGPSSSGVPSLRAGPDTTSLPKTDSGRIDADALAGSSDLSDAGWGIRTLQKVRLNAAREAGVEAAPAAITPQPEPASEISEIEEVPVLDTPAHATMNPGTKPARATTVMSPDRRTPSPPSTSSTRAASGINRLPSGPKVDGMPEPLTSMRSFGDETISAITEALGLGPLDTALQAREAQIEQAGRLLRNAIVDKVGLPPAATVRKLSFYEGLDPGLKGQLGLAVTGADCVISERERVGKRGKRKHVLRVQFHASIDRGEHRLATQPGSPNYKAVQEVAQRLAEAIDPKYRTDERQYAIEFVGASIREDSSAAVFIQHFAEHAKAKPPKQIKTTSSTMNDAHLRNSDFFCNRSPEQMNKLAQAAHVSHLNFEEQTSTGRDGKVHHNLRLFFGGSENLPRDYLQAITSSVGGVGKVFVAAREVAQITAQAVEQWQHDGHEVRFEFIGGGSMGGAAAQVFAAALQSHVKLAAPAPLVLLDPQLLNNTQARHATKGGVHDYDFASPRGVAITLDYPAEPQLSLMGRMKGLGYSSPGLVRIKLALQDGDRDKQTSKGDWVNRPPKPYGPPLTGYHADFVLYKKALLRFTGSLVMG
ncbi:type III effector protein [Ralstonia solanacearum]|uniref:type III effector protein n=1 Tax=Ralstonia solanacearum TaxID=305 RepID=UPI00078CB8AE|nr:type III effector protein [Ralstonia solanacearum]AXV89440.1 type III effector protein [Ralstonia solanacearum]AXW08911.1 type III effector protein [Ralstonia solanacearum]AXW26701.1 type III effector protein [Ralstonia solanacearum]AXW83612.1 type III effector protein [Ralstonia solanacearum]